MLNKYPRVAIIGDTGEGKTLAMTAIALMYAETGKKIFSNYELIGVDYTYVEPADLVEMFFNEDEELYDCIILTDEAHIDLGNKSWFSKQVQGMGEFATQTRKRRIIWIITTQVFTRVCKDIRDLTTYFIYCKQIDEGIFKLQIHDRDERNDGYIKTLYLNGEPYYGRYDTEKIIKKTIKPKEDNDK